MKKIKIDFKKYHLIANFLIILGLSLTLAGCKNNQSAASPTPTTVSSAQTTQGKVSNCNDNPVCGNDCFTSYSKTFNSCTKIDAECRQDAVNEYWQCCRDCPALTSTPISTAFNYDGCKTNCLSQHSSSDVIDQTALKQCYHTCCAQNCLYNQDNDQTCLNNCDSIMVSTSYPTPVPSNISSTISPSASPASSAEADADAKREERANTCQSEIIKSLGVFGKLPFLPPLIASMTCGFWAFIFDIINFVVQLMNNLIF